MAGCWGVGQSHQPVPLPWSRLVVGKTSLAAHSPAVPSPTTLKTEELGKSPWKGSNAKSPPMERHSFPTLIILNKILLSGGVAAFYN